MSDNYAVGAVITGGLAFIVIWVYAILTWGLLLGLIIGWLPAMIGAVVLGYLWPLVVAAAVLLFIWISNL